MLTQIEPFSRGSREPKGGVIIDIPREGRGIIIESIILTYLLTISYYDTKLQK